MKYEGLNGHLHVEGETVVITRDTMAARTAFGKNTPPRRIPLQAVSGVTFHEPTRLRNGWLHLHLGGETPTPLTPATAASNGDAVIFSHGKREQWEQLRAWLLQVIDANARAGIDPSTVQFDRSGGGQAGKFDRMAAHAAAKAEHQQGEKRAKAEASGLRPDIADAASRMGWQLGGKREIKKLHEHLYEGETVEYIAQGAYAGNQGIVVLTSARMLFLFHGVMSQVLEDFPYRSLSSVQSKAGFASGDLTVHASGNSAVISQIVKQDLKYLADALRQRIATGGQPSIPAPAVVASTQPDVMDQLRKLGELRDAGILSEDEFAAKKAELLSRL